VQGLLDVKDLLQEAVLISKSRALITTLGPKHVWELRITSLMQAAPNVAISCIKFRKALGLRSPIWLKPILLEDQIRSTRQQQQHLLQIPVAERSKAALQTQLRVEGLPQIQHESICRELMQKISEVSQIPFAQATSYPPSSGEWAPRYHPDGTFAQQITVQLMSEDALKSIIRHVNGSGIRVGGKNLVVEVRSAHPSGQAPGQAAQNFCSSNGGSPNRGVQCL